MLKSLPDDMAQIIAYLYYQDAGSAIEFMQKAFGFEIEPAFRDPGDDQVLHTTIRSGSGVILDPDLPAKE